MRALLERAEPLFIPQESLFTLTRKRLYKIDDGRFLLYEKGSKWEIFRLLRMDAIEHS